MTTTLRLSIRLALIAGLIGFSLISTPGRSYACSCVQPGTPSEELARSTAVFVGRVISVTRYSRDSGMVSGMDPVTVEFDVQTIWKGPDYETMYLTTARFGGSCGIGFGEGDEYLVYSPNGVTVHLCTRTRLLSEAASDLEELGEGRSPALGTVARTPVIPDDLVSGTPVPPATVELPASTPAPTAAVGPSGGCRVGSAAPDLWMTGLLAGVIWFGVRGKKSDADPKTRSYFCTSHE